MKNITIAGNVGKAADLRTTQNGTKVTNFSVAVNHFDGREKSTMWFDVAVFGRRADTVVQFAQKGAKIAVTGDLSAREHNGKTYLQIAASDFTPMGGGQEAQQRHPNSGSDGYQAPQGDPLEDEIPF